MRTTAARICKNVIGWSFLGPGCIGWRGNRAFASRYQRDVVSESANLCLLGGRKEYSLPSVPAPKTVLGAGGGFPPPAWFPLCANSVARLLERLADPDVRELTWYPVHRRIVGVAETRGANRRILVRYVVHTQSETPVFQVVRHLHVVVGRRTQGINSREGRQTTTRTELRHVHAARSRRTTGAQQGKVLTRGRDRPPWSSRLPIACR